MIDHGRTEKEQPSRGRVMWGLILLIVGVAALIGQYLVGVHKDRESKQTEKELRSSIKATDLQVEEGKSEISDLKEKVREKDEQIIDLQRKSNVIQTVSLFVLLDVSTPPLKVSDLHYNQGLSSCLAFFEKNGTRYRFCSDGKWEQHQYETDRMRVRFVFAPEDISQFGGNPITMMAKIETLGTNFSDFLQKIGYMPGNGDDLISVSLFLNGIEVTKIEGKVGGPGSIISGLRSFQVSDKFDHIPELYAQKIREKAK